MRWYQKSHFFPVPALTMPLPFLFPLPALAIPFPVYKFPNKLAPKILNNILKNPPLCSFVSLLIDLVTPFSKIFKNLNNLYYVTHFFI